MARQYKTGLIITGDASGGIRAIQATDQELGKLNQGFDRGSARSKAFGRDVGSTSRELQLLRRAAAPVGAMLAGMFAARSLQNQIQFADELQKLNLRIGASTEALSQYSYVAKQSGVEFGQLTTAWQRQTRRINEAAQGTGVASKALETLNLSARELAGLAPEDQFERIAAAMQGVADEGQRVALAQKLWDSEGVRLVQIVNQGTDAIAAMRAEADRFGLTVSQDTANAMATYNDEVARLQAVAEGVSRQILAELVPAMTSGLQAVSAFVDRAGGAEAILDGLKVTATGVAAVMAGRYAGAIGIATAAKLAAIQQAVAYQLALARMAGVSGTAAASQIALAGAVRGASGAMALVGGPVGAAVIAAGAIYYFREELGLVKAPIEAVTSEVDALTNAINMNSEASLKNGIAQLTADLAELQKSAESANSQMQVLQMQGPGPGQSGVSVTGRLPGLAEASDATDEAEQKVANYTAAIGQLEAQLESLGKSSVTPVRNIAATSEASKEAKKAGEQHAAALAALRREMDPGMAEAEKFADRTATLTKALASGAMGAAEHGQAIAWATQQYLRAATGAEELEKQQQSLIQQYDRHRQRARQLRADLDGVNQMYRAGVIDGDQYARMVAEIRDEMERLAFDADPAAQEMARAWEEASKRIDETFADAFAGAFDSFDDFADQLLDGFKRLLAELAYQATLRPIVVGFTGQMQGAMGMPGAGGDSVGGGFGGTGGMGGMLSTGRNVWNAAQQGFGNIAWTGASNTAYAGGWAGSATSGIGQSGLWGGSTANFQGMQGLASAGAGLAGAWAGNQVFGSSEHGGTLSAIGGTIGAYWGPPGAAIGSFIGSGLGALFGHEKTPFRGEFVTREREQGWQSLSQQERRDRDWYYGHHVTESALGTLGFTHSGSQRVHRAFDMDAGHDAAEWAQELANAAAEMDNFLAALVDSDDDVQAMADAVQSLHIRSGDASKIIEHALVDRPLAAIEAVGLGFGERITDAIRDSASPQEAVESLMAALSLREAFTEIGGAAASDMMDHIHHVLEEGTDTLAGALEGLGTAYSAMVLIDSGVERLNLQFDSLAEGAIHAAWAVQDMAGGLENLAQLQTGYYQAFFTEAERFEHLAQDLGAAFSSIGLALPSTRGEVRNLVEGLDLMTESGREQYAAIMQLVPQLDQYVQGVREHGSALSLANDRITHAVSDSLDAYNRQISSIEDVAAARREQLQDEMRAVDQLGSLIDSLLLSNQSILGPMERLQEAQRQFAELQVRAESGDTDAVSQLQGASRSYLDAAAAYYGQSSDQYARIFGDVNDGISDLETQFGQSVARLGSIESIEQRALREQQQARSVLEASLRTEIDQLDSLDSITDLLSSLPSDLARQIAAALPKAAPAAGGGGGGGGGNSVAGAINDIYRDVLGRDADAEGMSYWMGDVARGHSLDDIRRSIEANKSAGAFAMGGAFTNGVVDRPTAFPMGLMGEAGPEAIMPLSNVGGKLGVNISGAVDLEPLTKELHALRQEVAQLRAERRQDATQAAQQRVEQVREQRKGNRNSRVRGVTV